MKLVHPSITVVEIKDHTIRLTAKKGIYSLISDLNINPKTNPIVRIWTPMPIVSQNGPTAERR
jgi:hypothetical protein